MKEELKACEHATYVHYLIGGPEDGAMLPSRNCFEMLLYRGFNYKRTGEVFRMPGEPTGLNVLFTDEEYREAVFYRVELQYVQSSE